MSAVLNALQKLSGAIDNLDASFELYQANMREKTKVQPGVQPDMFAARLDETIKKVEIILDEA